MSNKKANEKDNVIVQLDNSILIQIRIDGVLLAPQIIPLTALGQIQLIANAQLTTYQSIKLDRRPNTGNKTD